MVAHSASHAAARGATYVRHMTAAAVASTSTLYSVLARGGGALHTVLWHIVAMCRGRI